VHRFFSRHHFRDNDVTAAERTPPNCISYPFIAGGQNVTGNTYDFAAGSVNELRRYIEHVKCNCPTLMPTLFQLTPRPDGCVPIQARSRNHILELLNNLVLSL
jgi:hypothetical protein